MPEILPDSQPRVTEMRTCRIPLKYSARGPFVGFDPKNAYLLPCDEVYTEASSLQPNSQTPEVPLMGCLKQRQAELCPRGLVLSPQEEKLQSPEKSKVAK